MRCRWIVWVFLVCAWPMARADEPPILRYTSWMLVETGGKATSVRFLSSAYARSHKDYVYKDAPLYTLLSADGQFMDELHGKLESETTIAVPASAGAFALIEAKPGNNYCVAYPEGPYGFVATEAAPLNVVRGFERLYFFVPKGLDGASIFFHAFSVGEAVRVIVRDSAGKVAVEREDDFNQPGSVIFNVPEGQDGKVWSLSLVKPQKPEWKLDDCKLWFGSTLPGLLCRKPEWAERLSKPFAVSWRRILDFEGENPIATAQWEKPGPTFAVAPSTEQAHLGKQSLRIEMNLPEKYPDKNGLKVFTKPVWLDGIRRVRFWLYGDGSGRKLTVRVRDHMNEHHYCDAGEIKWKGWGEVMADFKQGEVRSTGGDANKRIDGPTLSFVLHISHDPGQPAHSVYYMDDLSVSP